MRKSSSIRIILLLVFSTVALGTAPGVPGQPAYLFRSYSARDGLSSNTVMAMIQDRRGVMWIGTGNGLDMFDGREFISCPISGEGESSSVSSLLEDSAGMIWVGTEKAAYRYDGKAFTGLDGGAAGSPSSTVTAIVEDGNSDIWMSTREQGIFRWRRSDGKVSRYLSALKSFEQMFVDADGLVWACPTFGPEMVYTYDRDTDSFVPADLVFTGKAPGRVGAAVKDPSGGIMIASWDDGLFRLDPRNKEVVPYVTPADVRGGLRHVHSIAQPEPWVFLVGSDEGLLWIDIVSGRNKLYVNDIHSEISLSNKFVYPILTDKEGGIWVGTYYGGVNYVAPNSGQFETRSMTAMTGGTEEYTVSCFLEDGDGSIWVGSDNGGLMHFDPHTNAIIDLWTTGKNNPELSSLNIHSLLRDGDNLWIGTYSGGVNRLNTRTGTNRVYDIRSGLNDGSVYSLFRDADGRMWAATMSGIHLYDPDSDRFILQKRTEAITNDIYGDDDGNVWFATEGNGVCMYSPSDGSWKEYMKDSGLPADRVDCLFGTADGTIMAGTSNGLCRFDRLSGRFERVDIGYDGEIIFGTVSDGQIWMTTGSGLMKSAGEGTTPILYGRNDGIFGTQFVVNSGMVTRDGKVYVGSTGDFNSFYPKRLTENRFKPGVMISDFMVREPGSKSGDTGYKSVSIADGTIFNHRQKDIRFVFAALSYCAPEKNLYSCFLDGYDKSWRTLGNQNWIEYNNLPPGHYTLRVNASNNDGLWSDDGAGISFVIKSPFLMTKLAMLIYVILGLALVWALVNYLNKRSADLYERKYEEGLRRQREEDLTAKVDFVTKIAHEIKTPLSLIAAPVERIKARSVGTPAAIRSDLSVIDRNSRRLMALVNQILDFSRINSEDLYTFHPEHLCINDIVARVADSFTPTMDKERIAFSYECDDPGYEADVDREVLTKIVSNLMSNAVKYTRNQVSMSLETSPEGYVVRVRDNGTGISPEDRSRIFAPFYRVSEDKQGTGLGLSIVRQLVELSRGGIEVDSEEGVGTVFSVTMPSKSDIPVEETDQGAASGEDAGDGESQFMPERPTVLIVEDDPDMLSFLSSDFQEKYNVLTASDGKEAKTVLATNEVSLVISDWMMPEMSGDQLCRYVRSRKKQPYVPFIMLTARDDDRSVLTSLDCGADAHVKKPFSIEYLRALANHLVDLHKTMTDRYFELSDEKEPNPLEINPNDFMSRVRNIIEANIANTELSVGMLASELCVSRSGLFSKVKESCGMTPNSLITEARLSAAAKLLKQGKSTVNEICYMVGFSSPSYFSKCFVKKYGMTPQAWKQHQAGD